MSIIAGSAKLARAARGAVTNHAGTALRRVVMSFTLAAAGWCGNAGGWVALDVGHTLEKPGASSARGRLEFEFNRTLAMDIAAALRRENVEARIINADGRVGSLSARAAAARGAQLLLAVHHDSVQPQYLSTWTVAGTGQRYGADRFRGFSLFVSRRATALVGGLRCASSIGAALRAAGLAPSLYHAERIAGEFKPFADRANGVHYFDNLAVLKAAATPAVLLEAGVIVNRDEELQLQDPARVAVTAAAVARGVVQCLAAGK